MSVTRSIWRKSLERDRTGVCLGSKSELVLVQEGRRKRRISGWVGMNEKTDIITIEFHPDACAGEPVMGRWS